MSNEPDIIAGLITAFMLLIVNLQFVLSLWAWRKQVKIEKEISGHVPESLKDRAEVTFWTTASSFLFVVLGFRLIFQIPIDVHILSGVFALALVFKTIPSARWLWRYYRGRFDSDLGDDNTSTDGSANQHSGLHKRPADSPADNVSNDSSGWGHQRMVDSEVRIRRERQERAGTD